MKRLASILHAQGLSEARNGNGKGKKVTTEKVMELVEAFGGADKLRTALEHFDSRGVSNLSGIKSSLLRRLFDRNLNEALFSEH